MDPHQAALVDTARRLGLVVTDMSPTLGHDVVQIERGAQTEWVREGKIFSTLSSHSEFLCQEKHVCKASLAALGIPVPEGIQLDDARASRAAIESLLAHHAPCVLKPSASEGGEGVHVGLTDFAGVVEAWQPQRHEHAHFVLEAQVPGVDLRIHALGGRLVAACVREAAYVVGDGTATIDELVATRQAAMRAQNPENRLDLDDDTDALLREQGLRRDAVPDDGQRVTLKRINNLALGGVAVDVTDQIHARYAQWVAAITERLALPIFALDVLTEDPGADPQQHARVIEINAKPDWLHHTFSERRTHDMPRLILEQLFGALTPTPTS